MRLGLDADAVSALLDGRIRAKRAMEAAGTLPPACWAGYPRKRRPRGVGRKPAASSACASGES
jgi:hypothetical protein